MSLIFIERGQAASLDKSVNVISTNSLKAYVKDLCSDSFDGRLTGSLGERRATRYVADIFRHLKLKPAGDRGSYFQYFDFVSDVSLGKYNSFLITRSDGTTQQLSLGQEWKPLSFSDNVASKKTGLVFAGYGITAPAKGKAPIYDSYQDLSVTNKWVVVFNGVPKGISNETKQQIRQFSSLRYKAYTAKLHGARGIIFVAGADSKTREELIPFSLGTSVSDSGIAAVSIRRNIIDSFLKVHRQSLQVLQLALDTGQRPGIGVLTSVRVDVRTDIHKIRRQGRNVLAKLELGSSEEPMIVVGAHVDHLGRGQHAESRARNDEAGLIHAGADDNASGVASLLAAAEKLSVLKTQGKLHGNRDILFAAWSGEELGILGSSHFVRQISKSVASLHQVIDAAINLDMVGHLRKQLVLQGTGSSTDWPAILHGSQRHPLVLLHTVSDPYLPTDSTAFYLCGVPTLNFFTGASDEYHTPRDRPESLNYAGMRSISGYLVNLVTALENKPRSLVYVAVARPHETTGRGFRVYLGTVPDYSSTDISGVKLSGVAKNSPAARAGIRRNDVIMELAGKPIHDIYDYTYALNDLTVGEPAKLVVVRNGTKIILNVIASHRD